MLLDPSLSAHTFPEICILLGIQHNVILDLLQISSIEIICGSFVRPCSNAARMLALSVKNMFDLYSIQSSSAIVFIAMASAEKMEVTPLKLKLHDHSFIAHFVLLEYIPQLACLELMEPSVIILY